MNFKYAIKGMKKNIIFNLLLFIQVSLAFTVIYEGVGIDSRINAEVDKLFNFFGDDKVYTIKDIGSIQDDSDKTEEGVNLLDKIRKEKNTTFTQQVDVGELIHCFDGYEKFLRYESMGAYDNEKGVQVFQVRNLLVNENFLETFNVKLDSGEFFKDDEYKSSSKDSKTIPVILGYDFKEHFKLGDIIKTNTNDSLKIIGFVEKDIVTPYIIDGGNDNYINLNKFIIRPYTYPRVEYWYNFLMFDKEKSDEDIANFIYSLQKDFKEKFGMSVDIEDLTSIMNENLDIYKMQKDLSTTAMISIIFFLLISLIVTNLNLIIKRKKEFGIHILNGGSLKDIAIRIYLETFLVLISAFAIFTLKISSGGQAIDTTGIMLVLLVAILISIVVTIIPIVKIMSLNIPSIVKGDE